ncbi:hypothetical protein Celaphus_00018228 [Cervus elaphus hippelaphus]|uniref:Uncharacterized protein n=1 Tax=Cervus elaphus hippelaphus TaxID=46360 RepID=A0A212C531_CEREH|nr:hypothetical protein Celaphus_00018228 [Cervus elaphus hippelaphus]
MKGELEVVPKASLCISRPTSSASTQTSQCVILKVE